MGGCFSPALIHGDRGALPQKRPPGRDPAHAGRGLRSGVGSRAALAPTTPRLWLRSGRAHGQLRPHSWSGAIMDNSRSARCLGELLWERPLAAMRLMQAAGFIRGWDRELRSLLRHPGSGRGQGVLMDNSDSIRGRARSWATPAPLVAWASFCGSGLWPRCGLCRPPASFGDGIASCARSCDTPALVAVRACSWTTPTPFVVGRGHGQLPLRSLLGRAFVGAASGRDAACAGRGLRSGVESRAALAPTTPRLWSRSGRALVERPPGRDAAPAGRRARVFRTSCGNRRDSHIVRPYNA